MTGVKGLTSSSTGRYVRSHRHENNTSAIGYIEHHHDQLEFLPNDEHNEKLISSVHPKDYINPNPLNEYDLVVIGAGVAGLLSVITAKWLGKRCALIESHAMGGDCLNIGCVCSFESIHSCCKSFKRY